MWPGSQGGRTPTYHRENVVLRTIVPSKVTRESGEPITVSLATSLGSMATHELPDTRVAQPLSFSLTTPQDTPSSQLCFLKDTTGRYYCTKKHTAAVGEELLGHMHVAWMWDCVRVFRISSKVPLRGSVQKALPGRPPMILLCIHT